MNVQLSDLATVGLLVVLEGLLSADNALVVAVMILGLPRREQKLALRYGLDGAFIIIALVGTKLLLEYGDAVGWIHFEPPKWLYLGIIAVTFLIAYVHARRKGPVSDTQADDEAAAVLLDRDNP